MRPVVRRHSESTSMPIQIFRMRLNNLLDSIWIEILSIWMRILAIFAEVKQSASRSTQKPTFIARFPFQNVAKIVKNSYNVKNWNLVFAFFLPKSSS